MSVVTICTHVLRGHDEGVLACFEPTDSPKWSGHVTVTLTIAKPNTNTTGDRLTSVRELSTCLVCLRATEYTITTTNRSQVCKRWSKYPSLNGDWLSCPLCKGLLETSA